MGGVGEAPGFDGKFQGQGVAVWTGGAGEFGGDFQQGRHGHGVKGNFGSGLGLNLDGLLPLGQDLGFVAGIEHAELQGHGTGVVRQVVDAADGADFVAFAEERRRLEFDEKVFAGQRRRGGLADQRFHRATARGQTPSGGGFRHRHRGHGPAVGSGDHRGQPAAFALDFAAWGGFGCEFRPKATRGAAAVHHGPRRLKFELACYQQLVRGETFLFHVLVTPQFATVQSAYRGGSAVGAAATHSTHRTSGGGGGSSGGLRPVGGHFPAQLVKLCHFGQPAHHATRFGYQLLGNRARQAWVAEAARRAEFELRMAARVFLEEVEDRRERVGADGIQRFVHQRQAQLGLHRLAGLVGDGDLHLAFFAWKKRLLQRFDGDLEFTLDGEVLVRAAQLAAVHRRHGEAEIREQLMAHWHRDVVVILLQLDDPVPEDRLALERHQRQAVRQPRVQAHRGVLADLERRGFGEEPELRGIGGVGDFDLSLVRDGLAETIRARGAKSVDAALLQLQRQRGLARRGVSLDLGLGGRDFGRLRTRAFAPRQQREHRSCLGFLDAEDGDLERLAGGFAVGAGGGEFQIKRFARDDHGLTRLRCDAEAKTRQCNGFGGGHVFSLK